MKRISLEEAKYLQYEMLKEIHRYTESHSLTYFLSAGTLLGAVRHQGFIPWDDDIDIIMPQPDFEKLMREYISDRYETVWCYNNLEYEYPFGRLYDKRTYTKIGRHQGLGIFIDIYVIFGAPMTKVEQEARFHNAFRHIFLRRFLIRLRSGLANRGLWPMKTLNCRWINQLTREIYEGLSVCNYTDSDYIHPYGGGKHIVKKSLYEKKILMKFCDNLFYVPACYDELLRITYGDYMQLPPQEARHPYHITGDFYWKK